MVILKDFCFEVKYEPGSRNPSDYGSRNLPPPRNYTQLEREDMGVEDSDEDMEVLVNRVEDMLPEAIITEVLHQYTAKDEVLCKMIVDINRGRFEENRENAKY